jgi:hypothetical protein
LEHSRILIVAVIGLVTLVLTKTYVSDDKPNYFASLTKIKCRSSL